MGWYRVCELPEAEDLSGPLNPPKEENPTLWSRGGLQGLEIHYQDKCFKLPFERMLSLVCDEVRDKHVSLWEGMTDDEVAKRMGVK